MLSPSRWAARSAPSDPPRERAFPTLTGLGRITALTMRAYVLTAIALILSTGLALACPEVQVAFDPTQAAPGDQVHFFSRLANNGTEPLTAAIEMSVTFNDRTFGPFTRTVELGAGFDHTVEFDFMIPSFAQPGTLTISVVASAEGCPASTATASLEIVAPLVGGQNPGDALGQALLKNGFTSPDQPGIQQSTWGEIKNQAR